MLSEYKRAVDHPRQRSQDAKLLFLLLAELLGVRLLSRRGLDRFGLIGAGATIDITLMDIDIRLFPQLGEISAEGGLQLLVVQSVLNLGEGFLEWRHTGHLVIIHFQDDVALLRADHIADLA